MFADKGGEQGSRWRAHEPQPGQFRFDGRLDSVSYVREAEERRLLTIARPGPCIGAEWERDGLPAWLLADPGTRLCLYRGNVEWA